MSREAHTPTWEELLATLTLDPDGLADPLPAPGPGDVIVCGSSRSGTTLLSAMLFQPPRAVCVMEPWDALRLAPAELFASFRAELETGWLRSGHLDVRALREDGAVVTCTESEDHAPVVVGDDYVLAVKCPVLWRYLDRLPETKFLVCVRDPRTTIASYRRSPGRLAEGLDYEVPFNERMNRELTHRTADVAMRRIALYDYVYERMLPHLDRHEVLVVRYERWFTEPDALLTEVGAFLGIDLSQPLARIRPPLNPAPEPTADDARERALIRRHCRTAARLGYDLGRNSDPVAGLP